jgi:hypothetical protein
MISRAGVQMNEKGDQKAALVYLMITPIPS